MRIEHDLIGELEIPQDSLWGIHTARALSNFPISGVPIGHYRNLIKAIGLVKQAATRVNARIGGLEAERAKYIELACQEVVDGKLDQHFVVDAIQGGAGTSTNMNANEVIANRALQLMGKKPGEYDFIHPLNDVNRSQSTNDVYPTAFRIALIFELEMLDDSMQQLRDSYQRKADEFSSILKMARTQLQDAVPITLGQEFQAFAVSTNNDILRLNELLPLLSEVNLGGTAVGTELNTPKGYTDEVVAELSKLVGKKLVSPDDLVEATQSAGVLISFSSTLKRIAVRQSKIANDLRLLSSGPRAGLNEINLPEQQAGSSIMPGKVNPVIPEVINQIAFTVIGNDLTVTLAAEGGQLQLNAFEPIMARSIIMSITYLRNGFATFTKNCVDGITANEELLKQSVENSIGLVTVLSPQIGYENATKVARYAQQQNCSVRQAVLDLKLMSEQEFNAALGDLTAIAKRED
ncbi:MAG: aspartate ammonia-lyase [Aquiluna sp.]